MAVVQLAIEKPVVFLLEMLGQRDKSHFRRIGHFRKHAFPTKNMAKVDAVQSAYELAMLPNLNRLCDAHFMEFAIRLDNFTGNPGAALAFALDVPAIRNHAAEILIERHFKDAAVQDVAHAFGNDQLVEEKHRARIGRPPQNWVIVLKPWKNAVSVGQ